MEFPPLLEVGWRAEAALCASPGLGQAQPCPAAPAPAFYEQIWDLHLPTQPNRNSAYLFSQRWGFLGSSGAENVGAREMEKPKTFKVD